MINQVCLHSFGISIILLVNELDLESMKLSLRGRSVQNADFRLGYVVCNTNSPDDMFMFAFEFFSSMQQYKYNRAC